MMIGHTDDPTGHCSDEGLTAVGGGHVPGRAAPRGRGPQRCLDTRRSSMNETFGFANPVLGRSLHGNTSGSLQGPMVRR
jgi:hypothetical protein